MTRTHTASHTRQRQSRGQRLTDRWSLSNRQETKNMAAFLHSLIKHAQTHRDTLDRPPLRLMRQPLKKATFLYRPQYCCVPMASAALLASPLIVKLKRKSPRNTVCPSVATGWWPSSWWACACVLGFAGRRNNQGKWDNDGIWMASQTGLAGWQRFQTSCQQIIQGCSQDRGCGAHILNLRWHSKVGTLCILNSDCGVFSHTNDAAPAINAISPRALRLQWNVLQTCCQEEES